MDTRCTQAQLILGYVFEDVMLLEEALTAAGNRRLDAAGKFTYQGNASLGFLGDAILQAGIGIESRQMGLSKGDTTDALKSHASNDVLAGKCDENGLTPCVLPAPGVRALANNTKATAVEAVIGAVFLDGGYEASSRVMRALGLIFEGQVTF